MRGCAARGGRPIEIARGTRGGGPSRILGQQGPTGGQPVRSGRQRGTDRGGDRGLAPPEPRGGGQCLNSHRMRTPRNAVTIDLEEYFRIARGSRAIGRRHWDRLPSRIEPCTERALELLRRHGVTATFFASAWIARGTPGSFAVSLRRVTRSAAVSTALRCRMSSASSRASRPRRERWCSGAASIPIRASRHRTGRASPRRSLREQPGRHVPRPQRARDEIPSLRIAGQTWPLAGLMLRHRTRPGAMRMIARWAEAPRRARSRSRSGNSTITCRTSR